MQMETRRSQCEEVSERLLAERSLAGDEDAFAILVHRYRPRMFSFVCHLTHNGAEAEDILQYVFLKLYLTLPTLKTDQPLEPWLFQVAHNRCVEESCRKRMWSFSEVEKEVGTNEVAEQHELQSIIQHAINTLPAKFCAIVQLCYEGQLSFVGIAQVLDIPEPPAKTYMHRAKPLLRISLHSYAKM